MGFAFLQGCLTSRHKTAEGGPQFNCFSVRWIGYVLLVIVVFVRVSDFFELFGAATCDGLHTAKAHFGFFFLSVERSLCNDSNFEFWS